VRVLHVGSGFAFEREDLGLVEDDVLDALALQIVEHDRADPDRFGDLVGGSEVGVLFANDASRLVDDFVEQLVEHEHRALAAGELHAARTEQEAEVDVLDARLPVDPHAHEHRLQLAEVELLLRADDVQAALEAELLPAVEERRQIARRIERRAVGLAQEARRRGEALVDALQIDDQGALRDLGHAGGLHALDGGFEERFVEALAAHEVVSDADALVGGVEAAQRDLGDPAPQLAHFALAAALELAVGRDRLLAERRILVDGVLAALVELEQAAHRIALEIHFAAPAPDRDDEPAELRTPVADVVDADGAETQVLEDAHQRRADDGRANVPDVHRLRDVGRGEVDDDRAPATFVRAAVARTLRVDLREHSAGERRPLDLEVQVRPARADGDRVDRRAELRRKIRRDRRRRGTELLRQREARKRDVAERRIARFLEPNGVGLESGESRNRGADPFAEDVHGPRE
jgi:hypothetical protein